MIGDAERLAFEVRFPSTEPDDLRGLAWADLVVWANGRRHWANAGAPIRWTWIDLVEHLARAWPFLLFEETAPFGLVALGPERLRSRELLTRVPGKTPVEVEDAVHAYQHRHDLAAGLKGLHLPPIWLLREGSVVRIRTTSTSDAREPARERVAPASEVFAVLERFVATLRERYESAGAPRARAAFERWDRRMPTLPRRRQIATGLSEHERRELLPDAGDDAWGDPELGADSPLLAAARLSQPLRTDTRRALLGAIASIPPRDTPELDALSRGAVAILDAVSWLKPYEQGHALAHWLRQELRLGDDPIDPAELLSRWNVHVADLPPLEPDLDAAACWGGRAGPAVLVNPSGWHNSDGGRRATLAHEIAHLLLDRGRRLLAAEVFGGSTPVALERRARAFAAELLLPREVAGRALAQADSLKSARVALMERYGVSKEIVGWQLKNGSGWELLTPEEQDRVSRWLGDRRRRRTRAGRRRA